MNENTGGLNSIALGLSGGSAPMTQEQFVGQRYDPNVIGSGTQNWIVTDGAGNRYSSAEEYNNAAQAAAAQASRLALAAPPSGASFGGGSGMSPTQVYSMVAKPMQVAGVGTVGGLEPQQVQSGTTGGVDPMRDPMSGAQRDGGAARPDLKAYITSLDWGNPEAVRASTAQLADMAHRYGYSSQDISNVMGFNLTPEQSNTNWQAQGVTPVSWGQSTLTSTYPGYTAPTSQPRQGGVTQYPSMPTRPSALPGTGGAPATYFPQRWWDRPAAQGFAEGGAVSYNPERVDSIYNQLKAQVNG